MRVPPQQARYREVIIESGNRIGKPRHRFADCGAPGYAAGSLLWSPSMPGPLASLSRPSAMTAAPLAACVLILGLAGCASMPGPGETVTVSVGRPVTAQDLETRRDVAAARPALQAAGIGPAEIAAGRVLRVQCAVMTDGWWDSLAILPPGFGAPGDHALVLAVADRGDNDRLPVNRVVARAEPPLGPGGQAYRFIPDWRERGLSRNFERQAPVGGPPSEYLIVQGSWLVRCRR